MKKKFDFSAEMNEAEPIKSNPKNEYLEEENRLLDLNIKELASLNDNVHEMSVNLVNSLKFLQEYRLSIAKDTQEQAEKFGQTVLDKYLQQIQDKCNETETENQQGDQIYFNAIHSILYFDHYTGCSIFFFRQHHSSKCGDFTLGCNWKGCFMDYFDYRNRNYYNDTSFENIEQAPIADYNKTTSFNPDF